MVSRFIMTFRFAVPDLDTSATATHVRQPADVLAAALGQESLDAAVAALESYLHTANRLPLRSEDRLAELETLQAPSTRLLDELALQYETRRLPLSVEARGAASRARSLLLELGYGYKRVLMEHTVRLTAEGRRALPFLLSRVMRLLANTLQAAYSTYSPTPAGTWQELHHLYHYASFYGLDSHPVDLPADQPLPPHAQRNKDTLASIYREVLLFALMDPYHLQPGEARTVMGLVSHFQQYLQVHPYREDVQGAGLFLIQANQDRPPRPLSTLGGTVLSPMDKLLDARDLVAHLQAIRRRNDEGNSADLAMLPVTEGRPVLLDLLARLERHWSDPPRRAFQRQPGRHAVELAPGLATIAAVAGGSEVGLERWQVLNESPGGLALRREGSEATRVAVGEQIAVRHAGQPGWQPGVVRWVHDEQDALLECGVQLLAPRLLVLSVRLDAADNPARPALQLPAIASLQRPALLVLARGSFSPGRLCWVNGAEGTAVLRLVRMEDHTQTVELVEFRTG